MASIATNSELALINATNPGTINLPSASQGRVLTFKDVLGTFGTNSLTLVCGNSDTFEDGATSKLLKEKYGILQIVGSGTKWYILNGTQQNSITASTIQCLSISTNSISSATTNVSTLNFQNAVYNISSLMYFNSNVFAGTRVWPKQVVTPISYAIYSANYPKKISGLSLWLDGYDSTTVSFSSANIVSTWSDKSTNGYNATNLGGRPVRYTPTPTNPKTNGLVFTGSTRSAGFSTYAALATSSPASTLIESGFFVLNFTTIIQYNPILNSSVVGGRDFREDGSTALTMLKSGVGIVVTAPNVSVINTIYIFEYIDNGTTVSIYVNGTFLNSASSTTQGTYTAGTTHNIGAGPTTNFDIWFTGYALEMIKYNSGLTTTQRQQIEGYLAWKWTIQTSLPTTHPYYYVPPPP